jgi:hypothetical protein
MEREDLAGGNIGVLTEEHLTVFARLVNTSSQEGLESQSTSRTPEHINPAMLERAHFPVGSVCCDETCHDLFYAVALPLVRRHYGGSPHGGNKFQFCCGLKTTSRPRVHTSRFR